MMRAPATFVIFVQTLGPTIAARIVLTMIGGRVAYRQMRRRGRLWHVSFRWYVVALAVIPAACLGAMAVLPGGVAALETASAGSMLTTFAIFLVIGFFSGPLFEEPGWRGFALPRSSVTGVRWSARSSSASYGERGTCRSSSCRSGPLRTAARTPRRSQRSSSS